MLALLFSTIAIALSILGFVPYIRSILQGKTDPHLFSWIIWGLTTVIVFFAQLSDEGGWGAWPTGISGLISIGIAGLAYQRRRNILINRTDVLFLVVALAAIPLWAVTSNPLWSVILLTFADTVATWPTLRKCWHDPFREDLWMYWILFVRNFFSIAGLEHLSLTTVLFPLVMSVAIVVLVGVVIVRRRNFATVN